MNKMLAAMAISLSSLLATHFAVAAPDDNERAEYGYTKDHDERREMRRSREEHGVKRLQKMSWQPGYVMPQHYRGNRYKVEPKDYNLPRPSRNQQWYKINKDYLLVDSESNSIIKIVAH
jgi:Ni/Co efflux regulator RcnB